MHRASAVSLLVAAITLPALVGASPLFHASAPAVQQAATAPRHIFVIVLENEGYNNTFGATPGSPYLGRDLVAQGRLLTQYYGTGHASLDNYIAMVSGQGPNPATQGDCFDYAPFVGTYDAASGQAIGAGCVYPAEVQTIGDQLEAAGLTWRQFAQSMAASPGVAPTSCRHQAIGSPDSWQGTTPDQYATRHVPFVYFHSVIDDQASCDQHVVDLELLKDDLATEATTPNLVFITPDACGDGHDGTCANASRPGGYAGIDQFLREWVPRIEASPAFQHDGLLVVNFDEADTNDASACCNETAVNSPMPGIFGSGGGRTGAVLLGPCILPGTEDATPYDHYSLLRTMEDAFGVARLGYAAQDGLADFDVGTCSSTTG